MRSKIIFFLVPVILVLSLLPLAHSELDVNNLKITVKKVDFRELSESRVIVTTANIFNDGTQEVNPFELRGNLKLIDSKTRQYSISDYLDLEKKGGSLSSEECPALFFNNVAPGLGLTTNLCFEIPKSTGLEYSLVIYKNMFCTSSPSQCQSKTISLNDNTNKVPETKNKSSSGGTDVAILQSKITELEKKIKSLEKELSDLKKQIATKDKKISDLAKQVASKEKKTPTKKN